MELGGKEFTVGRCYQKTGNVVYRYRLECEGLVLLLAQWATPGKQPNVVVRAPGFACLTRAGMVCRVWADACDALEALGGVLEDNVVSRVDQCADLVDADAGEFVKLYQGGAFVSRARTFQTFEQHAPLSEEQIRDQVAAYERALRAGDEYSKTYGQGLKATGVTIGTRGNLLCRIYDKLAECREGDKLYLMCRDRWGGVMPTSAVRVEFEVHGERLRECGIRTVEDLIQKQAVLARYLCQSWLVVRQPGLSRLVDRQRSPVHDLWLRVQAAFDTSFWVGDPDAELQPIERQPSSIVSRMLKGFASSYVAQSIDALPMSAAEAVADAARRLEAALLGDDGGETFYGNMTRKVLGLNRVLPGDLRPAKFIGQLRLPGVQGDMAYGFL